MTTDYEKALNRIAKVCRANVRVFGMCKSPQLGIGLRGEARGVVLAAKEMLDEVRKIRKEMKGGGE